MTPLLCIEDDPGLARLMQRRLERVGFLVDIAETAARGFELLEEKGHGLVLLDYWLPDDDGMIVLRRLSERPDPPSVIMITGARDIRLAVEAMQVGAADYLVKDAEGGYLDLLPAVIDRVLVRQRLAEEYQRAQELARVTLQSIGDAVIATDAEGLITYINPVAVRLTEWSPDEAEGTPVDTVFRIVEEESGKSLPSPVHEALREGLTKHCGNQTMLVTKKGRELPIADSAAPIRDGHMNVIGAVLIFQDASERRAYERNLALFEQMFQHTSEAILITEPDGTIIDVNQAFCDISGYGRDEVLGNSPAMMKSGRHDDTFYEKMWSDLLSTGEWRGEIWDRRKNGEVYPKWMSINAVWNREGEANHYVGVFSDITTQKQTEQRLHQLAHYDTLTGLPNRMLFHDRLQRALFQAARSGRKVALMFLDLDRFKLINDSLGHQVGDDLLTQAAERIRMQVRETDTVARLGGDEFTVILTELSDTEDAAQVAEKILEAFSPPFQLAGQEVFSTPSIGIGIFPDVTRDTEELIKAADKAMYEAKTSGRNNYVFFHPHEDSPYGDPLTLERELRHALENDQLVLHYQPQIGTRDDRTVGMEALLRWQHPTHGLLYPDAFLPLAVETGMIVEIGAWVLKEACRQNQRWNADGHGPLRIAVNVSARQLIRKDFPDLVARILEETGLDSSLLELELTEPDILSHAETTADRLRRLKALGLYISVDNFGTGYSSLAYLKRLPIDALKIDKSFIRDIHLGGDEAEISKAVIALSRSLNLRVIAEGVETEAQASSLRGERCCDLQGFYFSRPVSAEDATRLLEYPDGLGAGKYAC